jgi:hypothetical protein
MELLVLLEELEVRTTTLKAVWAGLARVEKPKWQIAYLAA